MAESCKLRYMSARPSTWACALTVFCSTPVLSLFHQNLNNPGDVSFLDPIVNHLPLMQSFSLLSQAHFCITICRISELPIHRPIVSTTIRFGILKARYNWIIIFLRYRTDAILFISCMSHHARYARRNRSTSSISSSVQKNTPWSAPRTL